MKKNDPTNIINNSSKELLNAVVYQYNTISDGKKRTYTNEDELIEYGNQGILDPEKVSFYNLFINGVLQPKVNYTVEEGLLSLETEDIPPIGVSIILSFITFVDDSLVNINSAEVEGSIPSGFISDGQVIDENIIVLASNKYHSSLLKVEIFNIYGEKSVIANSIQTWEFSVKVTNLYDEPVDNIEVTNTILLEEVLSITNLQSSNGSLFLNENKINWDIGTLNTGDYATLNFKLVGKFSTVGNRYVIKSMAMGNSPLRSVQSQIATCSPVLVDKGLDIFKNIISGPIEVNAKKLYTWKIEIKAVNFSNELISEFRLVDSISLNYIKNVKIINISKGKLTLDKNNLLWQISDIESFETVILIYEVTGTFTFKGQINLGEATATAYCNEAIVTVGPLRDINAVVHPVSKPINNRIILQKFITGDLFSIYNRFNTWYVTLKITNPMMIKLNNIMVTYQILLDKIDSVSCTNCSRDDITVSDEIITWNIKDLKPGESESVTIKLHGLFLSTGLRSIGRGIALSLNSHTDNCITSNIVSGPLINVQNLIIEDVCILADKIYSQCRQKECLTNVPLDLGDLVFNNILFKPGYIVENSLEVNNTNNSNFKRVKFLFIIPYEVHSVNGNVLNGFLPEISKDIILYMPEARDEFLYNISIKTNTKLLDYYTTSDRQLKASVGIAILIQVVSTVQMTIPAFKSITEPPLAEEYKVSIKYNEFKSSRLKEFTCTCDSIFGNLSIQKNIISGPIEIYAGEIYSWKVEIRVTNNGYGPVGRIVVTDTLYLDDLNSITIESVSHGDAYIENNKLNWKIGTLYSVSTAILTFQVTGLFNSKTPELSIEHLHYNTVSDGETFEFTSDDELIEYGSNGIIDPSQSTLQNLYINGVLQPVSNYKINLGILILTTDDIPISGVPITLESFIIKDHNNNLLKAVTYQYNTYATNKKIYCDDDEILVYGEKGILDPNESTYINLYINGILQPKLNYVIEKGKLTINANLPVVNSPIYIQFVSIFM
ncbi:DUF4183 domain-containing protein [Serpentinicella alkaliphila]|uniref:Uncharacterized protein DUF4183 n=1 Tax=Serpentinicella alkaliphila TaxID=1734049 RepID=A0A4R2SSU4_9FIRM|nr:DUF4183 domain-containing protein [Serpentinicella alkaliphila]QUH27045.1 DUF4183 domain-containing protein [Serpentinicella alkaliphila]TCP93399.1 uncharacterized protein DUF4183 [Serpentinicella alkaliphila]